MSKKETGLISIGFQKGSFQKEKMRKSHDPER